MHSSITCVLWILNVRRKNNYLYRNTLMTIYLYMIKKPCGKTSWMVDHRYSLGHQAGWLPQPWPGSRGQTEAVRVLPPVVNFFPPALVQSPPGQSLHCGSGCSMTPGGHQTKDSSKWLMVLATSVLLTSSLTKERHHRCSILCTEMEQ